MGDRRIERKTVAGPELIGFATMPVQKFTLKNVDVFGSRVLEGREDLALVGHGHQKRLDRFGRPLPIG